MQLKIFYKTFPETSRCPVCAKIGTIRRSRSRSILESVIKASNAFGIYKCKECGWRGVRKKYFLNRYSFITLAFYCGLVISAAYIISRVLKSNFGGG